MNNALTIALALLRGFEGCILKAYRDWVGVWTIGYGETRGVHEGMTWTQQQAEAQLNLRATQFMLAVLAKCPELRTMPPQRLAACTSLAYNIGIQAFGISSVCRLTRRGEIQRAGDSFRLWNKAGGKVSRVLTLRAVKQRAVYLSSQPLA
jgi:lysozyme